MERDDQSASADVSQTHLIGGSAQRIDSLGKVTGQTQYAEDMHIPGLLEACVLRCPHHHARLLSLDASRAAQMPGVQRIITAEDIPGENGLSGYSRDEPLLTPVGKRARQKGAPVALVVAMTGEQARRAATEILAVYEPLPHVFAADEALQDGAPEIIPGGNTLNTFTIRHGDLEAAFGEAQFLIASRYQTSFQVHSALEPDGVLGYFDEARRLTVVGGTHEPHWQVGHIARTVKVDPERVRVIVPPTGGSFGGRQDPWPLVAVGLMVHLMQQPVRLSYSRREVFEAGPKRHLYDVRLKIGATQQGRFTGIQVRIDANTGGYDSAGYWIVNYAATSSGGAYAWQAVDAVARSVYTNAPKAGQFRGYGAPQSVFALECALDELAQAMHADPLELRRANLLQQGQVSFIGYPVGESLGYAEVLDKIEPRYRALQAETQAFNARPPKKWLRMGTGFAGMWYRFGKSGSLRIETQAELANDGHFVVYCSAPDYGQGIKTVMAQLAAETAGLPRRRIELVDADTARVPDSGVQGASRATYFVGQSVCVAVENLKELIFATAAEMLDAPPPGLRLSVEGAVVSREPAASVSLAEVAQELQRQGKSSRVSGIFDLEDQFPEQARLEYAPLFVTGAQVAQTLVDLQTGMAAVQRVVAVHDVGRAINPLDAAGQIHGAVLMGIGAALKEEYLPGKTSGFADYILPMAGEMPEIEVEWVEVPSYYGPFGAKGLGEAAIMPTAPAILNGVSRAIGKRLYKIPATPERVLEAINLTAGGGYRSSGG